MAKSRSIWVASEGATSYNIKRAAASGGPYATIASIPSLSYLDVGLTNGVSYYYVVSAVNANGEGANSTEVNATPHATTLPAPWIDRDVGIATLWSGDVADVGWPGSASFSFNSFKIIGSGIDIWNQVDSFHFVYRAVSGDCTNIVRVDGLQNTDPWAKAGIMMRDTLNPDAINVFMTMTSQNGALFSQRTATGGACASSGLLGVAAPYWVKLVRNGNTFTGFVSPNDSSWTLVGSTNVSMAASAFVGMAVTAHNNTLTNTATLDSFSVLSQLPAAPGNLSASLQNVQAALNWSASPGAVSYNIKRSTTNNGAYSLFAGNVLTTNYVDTTVVPGTTYYYVVTAVNANGESANSNQATLSVTLPSLDVALSNRNLVLSWPLSAGGFTLYTATNLVSPALWLPVTNSAATNGNNLMITLPTAGGGSRFYRLKMQ